MNTYTRTNGFTIIETLVAISVLMIAIAGPLVVASKGLTSAVYSKNQMIASYLAQESMEVIKNRRDNNVAHGAPNGWLQDMGFCDGVTVRCDAGVPGPDPNLGQAIISGCANALGCSLMAQNPYGYLHYAAFVSGAPFYRYFYLEQIVSGNNGHAEFIAHVIVNWTEGKIPFQIHLTSTLVDVIR